VSHVARIIDVRSEGFREEGHDREAVSEHRCSAKGSGRAHGPSWPGLCSYAPRVYVDQLELWAASDPRTRETASLPCPLLVPNFGISLRGDVPKQLRDCGRPLNAAFLCWRPRPLGATLLGFAQPAELISQDFVSEASLTVCVSNEVASSADR